MTAPLDPRGARWYCTAGFPLCEGYLPLVSLCWPRLELTEFPGPGTARPPEAGAGRFEAGAAAYIPSMAAWWPAGLFRLCPGLCAVRPGLGLSYESLRMEEDDGEADERRPVEALFVPYTSDLPGAGERALAALRDRLPGVDSAVVEEGSAAFVVLLLEGPADRAAAMALANAEGALVLRASVVTAAFAAAAPDREYAVLNLRGFVRAAFPEKDSTRLSVRAPFVAATWEAFDGHTQSDESSHPDDLDDLDRVEEVD
jgi:hypothetical protein